MSNPTLQRFWHQRPMRERYAIATAGVVLGAATLWQLGIAPAWRTLAAMPAQQQTVQQQLNTMQALAAQARALQGQRGTTVLTRTERLRVLEAATTQHLGAQAQVTPGTDQVQVTLQEASAAGLAQWLQQVRVNAQLQPSSASLTRHGERWSGQLVLTGEGLDTP